MPFGRCLVIIWRISVPAFLLLLLAIWPIFGYNIAAWSRPILSFVAIFRRHSRCSISANRVCNLVVFVVVKLASYISLVS